MYGLPSVVRRPDSNSSDSVQIVVITMIALALSEDSISKRAQRDTIIESLAQLPENTRKVCRCSDEAACFIR